MGCPHYVGICKDWYGNVDEQRLSIVFPPLYPILIRLATLDYKFKFMNLSALFVSNISSMVAAIYLFKLAVLDFGEDVGKRSVLYLSRSIHETRNHDPCPLEG